MTADTRLRPHAPTSSERWEHGSNLHVSFEVGTMLESWGGMPHSFWGSGRDALRALIAEGVEQKGWKRLLVPSYYCQDALVPLKQLLRVEAYQHAPNAPARDPVVAESSDVALVASLFGMPLPAAVRAGGIIVEDHTHDPWSSSSRSSGADYAFASLRKTLPLPDGGVIWSPIGRPTPPEVPVTVAHDRAALDRLRSMTLKHHYLAGEDVDKDELRRLATRGEQALGVGPPSGMSSYSRARLPTLPAMEWRERRAANLLVFRKALGQPAGVTLLDASFAAVMLFDSPERRERVRAELIGARIYPTVYWPLDSPVAEGIAPSNVAMSHRILSLHCDYRYTATDMERVATQLRRTLATS